MQTDGPRNLLTESDILKALHSASPLARLADDLVLRTDKGTSLSSTVSSSSGGAGRRLSDESIVSRSRDSMATMDTIPDPGMGGKMSATLEMKHGQLTPILSPRPVSHPHTPSQLSVHSEQELSPRSNNASPLPPAEQPTMAALTLFPSSYSLERPKSAQSFEPPLRPASAQSLPDRGASSRASISRKQAPRMTESLENLDLSLAHTRESMSSQSTTMSMHNRLGIPMAVGGDTLTPAPAPLKLKPRSQQSNDSTQSIASTLSRFSFRRRSGSFSGGSNSGTSYRKVSISAPKPVVDEFGRQMSGGKQQLAPIPQSPFIGSPEDASSPPQQKKRKFTMPKGLIIPSRKQSLPPSGPLVNARSKDIQLPFSHFNYHKQSAADNRVSMLESVDGTEEEAGNEEDEDAAAERLRRSTVGSGLNGLAGLNIQMEQKLAEEAEAEAEAEAADEQERRGSDQTFKSDFSLTKDDATVSASEDETEDEFGHQRVTPRTDTELDDESIRGPPTPTLILESGSSGDDSGPAPADETHTPTASVHRTFADKQARWLAGSRTPSNLQAGTQSPAMLRAGSRSPAPNGSGSAIGLHEADGDATPTASQHAFQRTPTATSAPRRTRHSWQALKDIEAKERVMEEQDSFDGKRKPRKLLRSKRPKRSDTDDSHAAQVAKVSRKQKRDAKKAEKQRFLDECDVPPSAKDLFDVSMMNVYDIDGEPVRFGDIVQGGGGHKTVVIFIRHWYCPLCGDYMEDIIRTVNPEMLQEANAELVIIGHGSVKMLPGYSKIFGSPFKMYTDPTLQVYRGLGMTMKSMDAGAEEDKGDYVKRSAMDGTWQVAKRATKMPLGKPGSFTQLGGEFIFSSAMHCDWAHRMTTTRSHASIRDILELVGVDFGHLDQSDHEGSDGAPPVHGEFSDAGSVDMVFGNWDESGVNVSPAERYALEERKRGAGLEWEIAREEELERIRYQREQRREQMENMGLAACSVDFLPEGGDVEEDGIPNPDEGELNLGEVVI